MRVTQNMVYGNYLNDIIKRQESIFRLSERLSTGKAVNRPSDDPVKASSILASKGLLSDLDQYGANIESGISYLGRSEEIFHSTKDVLTRLKELAVAFGTGTVDAQARQNAAIEVGDLYDQLISLANTSYEDRYLFSGYKTSTAPFDPSGVYQGDANKYQIAIGPGATVTIGITGGEVFSGSGGGVDIFQGVTDLKNALLADDSAAVNASITALDASFSQVSDAVSDIGAKLSRLTAAEDTVSVLMLDLKTRISRLQDADITEVVSEYQMSNAALQAALAVSAKVMSVNIFDYL